MEDFITRYDKAKEGLIERARVDLLIHCQEMFARNPDITAVGWVQYNPLDCFDSNPIVTEPQFTKEKDFSNITFNDPDSSYGYIAEDDPFYENFCSVMSEDMLIDIFGGINSRCGVHVVCNRYGFIVSEYNYEG